METLRRNIFLTTDKINHLKSCVTYYSQSLLSLWSRLESSLSLKIASTEPHKEKQISKSLRLIKLRRVILQTLHALVVRVGAVINSKDIVKHFPRFITGLVLMVWVAPYADVFYTRLDFNDRVSAEVWYYESYHWLFLCLGPYLKNIFVVLGLYLCLVYKPSLIKTVIVAYPLMYDVAKILWLLQVDNHDEYKALPTDWFYAYAFITSVFILYMIDLLAWWFNHRLRAIKARLLGIKNLAPYVSHEQVSENFVKTMQDFSKVEQFNL